MIRYIINAANIHALSRPQTPGVQYTSLVDFNAKQLIGAGGQNPINCGSSMFQDTPTMEPRILALINAHFTTNTYLFKYERRPIIDVAKVASLNLIDFKNDLVKRHIILEEIFNRAERTFKNDIYSGYIFIFISIYFMLNYTLFNGIATQHTRTVAAKYFTDEADLLNQVVNALYEAPIIENINGFCHGRYFFVDSKLCDYNDFKPVPLRIVELLKNHN
jgi:hypothetical protein